MAILFGKKLYGFASQCQHVFFLIYFILTNTQLSYAVTFLLFNYISKVIFSPLAGLEMRVTQYFCYVSVILCSFVYQHSGLEVSCSNGTNTRHGESRCCLRVVAGHEI